MSLDPSLTTNEPTAVPGQADEIGALAVRIAAIEGANPDTRLDAIEAQNLDGRIDVLEGQTLDARLDILEGNTLDSRLDTLEGQLLDGRLDTLEGLTLGTRLGVLEDQELDSRLDAIEGQTLDSRLTIIEDQGLDARVDALEGQSLDSRLDVLEGYNTNYRLNTLEGQTLDARLDVLEAHNIDSRLDVLEGQTLDSRLDALEALTIGTRLTALEAADDALEALIAAQDLRLDALEALNGFSIKAYGALCNGSADDADAWEAAIEAADAAGGGIVIHPGGVSCISRPLVIPENSYIAIQGAPSSVLKATNVEGPFTGPMITKESIIGGVGARYGFIEGLRLDGNDIAPIGIRAQVVQQQFNRIVINKCTRVGFYNAGSQNCDFLSCNFEDNGTTNGTIGGAIVYPDANYLLDLGARNNGHFRCQFGAASGTPEDRGIYNIAFVQSEESDIADGEPPSDNHFYACQVERRSTTHLAAVYHGAGRGNSFTKCTLQFLGGPIIHIDDAFGYTSDYLEVTGGSWSGDDVAILADHADSYTGPSVVLNGTNRFPGLATLFEVDDLSGIMVQGTLHHGATICTPLGTKTAHGLVFQYDLRIDGTPNNTTGIPPEAIGMAPVVYSATTQRKYLFQGGNWRYLALTAS